MRRATDAEVRIFEMVLADPPVVPLLLHRDPEDGRIMVPDDFQIPTTDAFPSNTARWQALWLFDYIETGFLPLREA